MANNFITIADFDYVMLRNGLANIKDEFTMIDNLGDSPIPEDLDQMFEGHSMKTETNNLFLCVEGSLTVKVNLVEYRLAKNDSLVVLIGSLMEFVGASDDVRMALISFSEDYFAPPEYLGESMMLNRIVLDNPLLRNSQEAMDEYIDVYMRMKRKLEQKDNPFRKLALKAYSDVLCALSFEHLLEASVPKQGNTNRPEAIYNEFMDLLRKDFREHHAIQHYADALGVSPKYFSMIVKKVSGKSAADWIDEYLLLEAKMLLKSRNYNVQQICYMLSFPNQSFFAKYFKAHTGLTPTQYQSAVD